MKIALTGASGFLGRYVAHDLVQGGHQLRAWYRPQNQTRCYDLGPSLEWLSGQLGDADSSRALVHGCDAVIHSALHHAAGDWSGAYDLNNFLKINFLGSIELIQASLGAGVSKFIFISSCAVHDLILPGRPLDETHPLYPKSHYGAHKAALEAFVHSYAHGHGFDICALRPCGIYGVAEPPAESKWYNLIKAVARGESVACSRGGKEVHVKDAAAAIRLLLTAAHSRGEVFNCCDRYISEWEVANLTKHLSQSSSEITGAAPAPRNQIETGKLRALGLAFGGQALLKETISQLLEL